MSDSFRLEIEQVQQSKLPNTNFENIGFGTVFTDHMFVCDYADGQWQTPQIKPYAPLTLDPSLKALHYGQAVFEGMKAYKDAQEEVWLFRPYDNARRINKSAERLGMPTFPEEWFVQGMKKLVEIDASWFVDDDEYSFYIRPFMFASENTIRANVSTEYKFMIICSPSQLYYTDNIAVKIADHYSRAASGGTGFAKAAGNYAAQFYPTDLAAKEGYQQIIWTDSKNHEYLEEAGTMNIFFRINDTLITAPTGDTILDGVTRKSVIALAKKQGIGVEERSLKVTELLVAADDGTLKEIFGCGTAVVSIFIDKFEYKGEIKQIEKPENSYMELLKKNLIDIQNNRAEDTMDWKVNIK